MAHDHAHPAHEPHAQEPSHTHGPSASERALRWGLVVNGGFLFVEATVGFAIGSLALLSDAVHMLGDVAALGLALLAARLSRLPATSARSFGLRRAEILGALANGLGLVVLSVFLVREAVERLIAGPGEVPGLPVLVVGVLGLSLNLVTAWRLSRVAGESVNAKAALAHVMADALGSVGAIVAAVLMLAFGVAWADPAVTFVISALVLWSAIGPLRMVVEVLLQFAPRRVQASEVREALLSLPGVASLHELHIWSLDGHDATLTAHLVVASAERAREIRAEAERVLEERFSIHHTTLQLEDDERCAQTRCPSLRKEAAPHAHAHAHAHDHVHA